MKKIGIDVGNVIFLRDQKDLVKIKASGKKAKALEQKRQRLLPICIEGALETIARLSTQYELFIISYCQESMESKSRSALRAYGIDQWIDEKRWVFVRDRADKAQVCLENAIDYMIDDKEEVLAHVRKGSPRTKTILFDRLTSAKARDSVSWRTVERQFQ